ncbi:MAG: hypothetical protein AAF639_42310 [Chloroflexota bacterium]
MIERKDKMAHKLRNRLSISTTYILLFLGIFLLTACGGGSGPPPPVLAENADVGASIQSDSWAITLLDQPAKDHMIGDEDGSAAMVSEREQASRTADGVWVIVPIQLTNTSGEEAMLTQKTIQIEDDQGRTYAIGDRLVHHAQVWVSESDRWGDRENQLVQNVQDAGVEREGPAIFDVAEDATGLRLILKDAEGAIALGFE